MIEEQYKKLARQYQTALTRDVVPFWERNSMDPLNGGYFTCLDRRGVVYDTDKFIWLQARQAWIFAMLCDQLNPIDQWLEVSKSGIDFLIKHAMSEQGEFYFSTTDSGKPLVAPYNIFSDCFAAMAFSQYAKVASDQQTMDLAYQTYQNILKRSKNPKGKYNKNMGNRPLKDFALPMILSNLVLEMEHLLPQSEIDETLGRCVQEVMEVFVDHDRGLIHEYVGLDGQFIDSFEGRLINPGHGLEAMWFMLDIGEYQQDAKLINRAVELILSILEFGWDNHYGGIFYFLDKQGHPPQQLEWDQKLWWVHLETLVALAKAMKYSNKSELEAWYKKVHDYTWKHFPDPEFGEWYGYLNRQGQPHLTLKGGKWKGCFHVPRALFQCWKSFEELSSKNNI